MTDPVKTTPCDRPGGCVRLLCSAVVALAACGQVSVNPPGADGSSDTEADGSTVPVADARPPGECSGGITQLLTNPGFDEAVPQGGAIGWTEQTVPLTYPSGQIPISPHSPDRAAWLGDIVRPEQRLSQAVTVPEGTESLSLVVYTCFVTQEVPDQAYDRVTIALLDGGGNQLDLLAEYTNLDASGNDQGCAFEQRTLEAGSPHAGDEIVLQFFGLSDGSTLTSFYFDTLSLNAMGTCPDGT